MMKQRTISLIIVAGFVTFATWYFFIRSPDTVSLEKLKHEFDRELLTESEQKLLESLVEQIRKNNKDTTMAMITENGFTYRKIFYKLLQKGLILGLKGEPDSLAMKFQLASEIAEIYEQNLNDDFLKKEIDFCYSLSGKRRVIKLTIDYYYNKGQQYLGLEDYKFARKHYEKSLKITRKINDLRREVDNLIKIQYILYRADKNDQVLQIGKEILLLVHQIGYKYREAWTLYNIGLAYLELSEYRKALKNFNRALPISKMIGEYYCEVNILQRMGIAYRCLGELSNAISVGNEAINVCQKTDIRVSTRAKIYIVLGNDCMKTGELTTAKNHFEEALKLLGNINSNDKVTALANLGELYHVLGVYDKALNNLLEASQVYLNLNRFWDCATTRKIIGDVYYCQGNYSDATEFYQQALNTIQQAIQKQGAIRSILTESEIYISIGDVYKEKKEWQSALEFYSKGLTNFTNIEYQEGIVHALIRIGNVYREIEKFDLALDNFRKAKISAETLGYRLLLSNAYYGIGLTYRDLGKMDAAEYNLTSAIDTIEVTRTGIHGDEKINYFATIQDLYEEMILLQYQQSNYEAAFNYSERSRARAFLDLFTDGPEDNNDRTTDKSLPPTLSEIQSSLKNNLQLIEYKVVDDRIIIFLIDRENLSVAESQISCQQLTDLITEFRETLELDNSQRNYYQILRLAKKLYSQVIEPIKSNISSEKIIYIIPDNILFHLPFAALVSPEGTKEKFLIEDYTIAYAPSAAILKYCLDNEKSSISFDKMKYFAIANPTVDLQFAEQEVLQIAKLFSDSVILAGSAVYEDTVKKCMNQRFDIIHFATHAIINENEPQYSFLIVGGESYLDYDTVSTRSAKAGSNIDGLLMMNEICDLNLSQVRLVVLSACNTAGGQLFRGEGIVGMNRAFMKAGASSTLTSLWKINDKFTMEKMTAFYEQWKNKDMNKAQALRNAQLEIINEMTQNRLVKFPHPRFWAAFNLTGHYN